MKSHGLVTSGSWLQWVFSEVTHPASCWLYTLNRTWTDWLNNLKRYCKVNLTVRESKWPPNQFCALLLFLTNLVINKYFVWWFIGWLSGWMLNCSAILSHWVKTFWDVRSQICDMHEKSRGCTLQEGLCMAECDTNPPTFFLQTAQCGVRCWAYYSQRALGPEAAHARNS